MKQSKSIQKSIENLNCFDLNKNEICQREWGSVSEGRSSKETKGSKCVC